MSPRMAIAGLLSLLAAGCVGETATDPASAPQAPAARSGPPPAPPPRPSADQCGAAAAQRFVGRPRTEVPVPVQPSLQRVACTTCPVTQDFNPWRLNFFFDAQSGLIKEARCG